MKGLIIWFICGLILFYSFGLIAYYVDKIK